MFIDSDIEKRFSLRRSEMSHGAPSGAQTLLARVAINVSPLRGEDFISEPCLRGEDCHRHLAPSGEDAKPVVASPAKML